MAVTGTPDTHPGNQLLTVKETQTQTAEGRGSTIGMLNRKGKKPGRHLKMFLNLLKEDLRTRRM